MTPSRLAEILGEPPMPHGSWRREAVYASRAAIRRARGEPGGTSPQAMAATLARRLRALPGVSQVETRPGGLLLITVDAPEEVVREVLEAPRTEVPGPPIPEPGKAGRPDDRGEVRHPSPARLANEPGVHVQTPEERFTQPRPLRSSETPVWPDFPRTWANPGFVVRYAYVRTLWVRRWAHDLGLTPPSPVDPTPLTGRYDRAVIRVLAEAPSRRLNPSHGLPAYLERLATAYHDAHEHAPALPQGDTPPTPLHIARLHLAEAVRTTLAEGLTTLTEPLPTRL
jgi:arginyl-tRNA synthetase